MKHGFSMWAVDGLTIWDGFWSSVVQLMCFVLENLQRYKDVEVFLGRCLTLINPGAAVPDA